MRIGRVSTSGAACAVDVAAGSSIASIARRLARSVMDFQPLVLRLPPEWGKGSRRSWLSRGAMFDFAKRLSELDQASVLCVGDLMLDTYVYGEVERISPEAPAPVLAVTREELVIGGAGNVARNVASLGARCIFVGVVGDDGAGKTLESAFAQQTDLIESRLVIDQARPTTRKTRFVSEHFSTHLLRADWELARPVASDVETAVIAYATNALPRVGAVVLSDYSKGVLSPAVVRAVIAATARLGKPVIVDPKYGDYSLYKGTTLITPNRRELAEATRMSAASDNELAAAASALAEMVQSQAVLVTLSEHGMTLAERGRAGPCARLRRKGARCVGRRRHRGRRHGDVSCRRCRLRGGDARRQCGGLGRSGQARHRHRVGGRVARPHPSRGRARARAEDRSRLVGARSAARCLAAGGPAHRLHQRLLRSRPPRPCRTVGKGARPLRPSGGRPQQRRLGPPAQGRRPPGASRGGARRGARCHGGGRSRGRVRSGCAARADPPHPAEGAGEGRRLWIGPSGGTRAGRGRGWRGDPGRYRAGTQHERNRRALASTRQGVSGACKTDERHFS